jgi:hypothetical protein
MLWVLAANDTFAPIVTTLQRLRELTDTGQAISVLMYPNTDHGIFEFVSAPDGSRTRTRNPDGYFRTTVDFALHGHLSGAYGDAQLIVSPGRSQ